MANFEQAVGGATAFNLYLTGAGTLANLITNEKNVGLYILNETEVAKVNNTYVTKKQFKQEILQPIKAKTLNVLNQATGLLGSWTTVYMSAEITQQSRLMEHPVEDGSVCADYKVKMPTEITVRVTLPAYSYEDILKELQWYKDSGQMIYIETKFGNFKNMQIVSIPVNLSVENVSRITFSIRFKEVLLPKTVGYQTQPANVKDTDTVDKGTQQMQIMDDTGRLV